MSSGQRVITGTGSASASGSLDVAPAAVRAQPGGVAQPSVVIPRPVTPPSVAASAPGTPVGTTVPGRNAASASGDHPAASGRAPEVPVRAVSASSQPIPVVPSVPSISNSSSMSSSISSSISSPNSPPIVSPPVASTPSAPTVTAPSTSPIKPSAVLRPSAVFQPSAVIMPGSAPVATPRPAVVLPASAMNVGAAPYNHPPGLQQAPVAAVFLPNPTQPPGPKPPPEAPTSRPSEEATVIAAAPTAAQPSSPRPSAQPAPAPSRLAHDFEPGGTATFEPAPARRPVTAPQPTVAPAEAPARPAAPAEPVDDASETLVGGSRADVVDIPLDDLDDEPSRPSTPTMNPEDRVTGTWTPPQFGVANEVIPLSPDAFHRLLPRFATVKSRDEVTDLLLDFLAEGFSRVIMFTHIKGEIRGRDARGEDLMVEAVRQIRIPATGPSLFSGVIERRQPYFGGMRTDTAIDAAFFSALGGVDGVVLCLPVILRDKVPLLVFASGSHNPVDPRSLHDLTDEVAAALERIIVADKARSR